LSRRTLATSGAFLVLLLATIVPKLMLGWSLAKADDAQLATTISGRLREAEFTTRITPTPDGLIVLAVRNSCRLQVRNGDQARVLRTVFQQAAVGYDPIQYGYRAHWGPSPASARSLMERAVQNRLAVLGMRVERPAVIALAEAGDCRGVKKQLDGLYVLAKRAA